MKKFIIAVLAIFLMAGVAYSHSIVVGPKEDGPFRQILPVHNDVDNAVTLFGGDVVVWDIDASTGDDDAWVTTTTSAATTIVAGVMSTGTTVEVGSGSDGIMVIYGVTDVNVVSTDRPITAGSDLCTSTTVGKAYACTDLSNGRFGHAVGTASNGSVKAFINP